MKRIPLKHVATLNDEVLPESFPPNALIKYAEVSDVSQGQPIQWKDPMPFIQAPSRARRIVKHNDILISTVRTYLRAVTQVEHPPPCAVASTGFAVVRPRTAESKYLGYILQSDAFIDEVVSQSVGVSYPAISPREIARIKIPFPEIEKQQNIAVFLDRETAEIDAFIADQERLIELLEERRSATITHAVTKGLDPTVPMKDSGIKGLGDVPEHWVSGPVKRFFVSLDSRRIPLSSEERSYRQGPFPYYGASGIIDMVDDFLFDEPLVLVSEDGANLKLRSTPIAFVATGKYWVNNHAHILRPRNEAVYFWAERLEALDISPWTTGAAQPKLTAEALMNLEIAVPSSAAECLDIQGYILRETSEIDAAVSDAREAIALSRERRAALISAAVTGQLDVSQAQRPVDEVLEQGVQV